MKNLIEYIKSELSSIYNKNEVESFVSLILWEVKSIDTKQRLLNNNIVFSSEELTSVKNIVYRLKKYEPIQYILGNTEFYGLSFKTDSRALIPRLETEELVDWIIQYCRLAKDILDIGTGSGCIAITLAKKIPNTQVSAIDISNDAIILAHENAIKNKVNVNFYQKDILTVTKLNKKYDLIVSNPPYVTMSEKSDIMPNVLNYEPDLALFVEDNNPVIFYEKIARLAQKSLNPNGWLFFEINREFGKDIINILDNLNFKDIELKKDIFGNDRFIWCQKEN